MAKAKKAEPTIELTRLNDAIIEVAIRGLTPVIPHKWSEKAKRQLPGHPEKEKTKPVREDKNPEEEAEACLYYLDDKKRRIGMPATAFKAAMVGACRFFPKPTMTEAKQIFFIEGEGEDQLVEIKGHKVMKEDLARLPTGSPDLRYRYYIFDWTAMIRIRFTPHVISEESIINLLDAAGRSGIGDWRPSAPKSMTGTFGTWRVDEEALATRNRKRATKKGGKK